MPPELMQQLMTAMGGQGGAQGAPPSPMGGGVNPMMALQALGGVQPQGGQMQGPTMPIDQLGQDGLAALGSLTNRDPQGELAVQRVRRALDLAHKLVVSVLPMVSNWNMTASKDLHVIGRQIADTSINLSKDDEFGQPPENMIMGIQGTGLPNRM